MSSCQFTPRERRLIARLRTPLQVQRWLNALPYNAEPGGETQRSFRTVVALGTAHCMEAALSAAVILEAHGWPPLVMSLESEDKLDHVIFVYRTATGWGSIARSRDPGLHGRKPVFRTLRDLACSYIEPYVDVSGRITGYGVLDLRTLGRVRLAMLAAQPVACGAGPDRPAASRHPIVGCAHRASARPLSRVHGRAPRLQAAVLPGPGSLAPAARRLRAVGPPGATPSEVTPPRGALPAEAEPALTRRSPLGERTATLSPSVQVEGTLGSRDRFLLGLLECFTEATVEVVATVALGLEGLLERAFPWPPPLPRATGAHRRFRGRGPFGPPCARRHA